MSIRLTTVAYCGKPWTSPSSSRRINASRIGVELTRNCSASALRDNGEPGGSSSEVISFRSRSNTCGAACRSRSSRPADRAGERRNIAGEELMGCQSRVLARRVIGEPAVGKCRIIPEVHLDLRYTNVLVHRRGPVNKVSAAVEV